MPASRITLTKRAVRGSQSSRSSTRRKWRESIRERVRTACSESDEEGSVVVVVVDDAPVGEGGGGRGVVDAFMARL